MEEVEENPDTHPLGVVALGDRLQHSLHSQTDAWASQEPLKLDLLEVLVWVLLVEEVCLACSGHGDCTEGGHGEVADDAQPWG